MVKYVRHVRHLHFQNHIHSTSITLQVDMSLFNLKTNPSSELLFAGDKPIVKPTVVKPVAEPLAKPKPIMEAVDLKVEDVVETNLAEVKKGFSLLNLIFMKLEEHSIHPHVSGACWLNTHSFRR